MNSRERVLRAVNHRETDRVPFDMFGTSQVNMDRIKKYLGVETNEEMNRLLGIDIWYAGGLSYTGPRRYYNGEEADFWGITQKALKDGDSSNQCPLRDVASVDEVESYKWPSPDDFSDCGFERNIDEHREFAIVGGVWAPLFHNVTWLCGFETTLANLCIQPEVSEALIRHVTDFWVGYTRKVLEAGKGKIDIIENCNDFGAQSNMIISPEIFGKFFKPALKRLYDVIKEYGAKVMQHCCGAIRPIIPELIEIGADILNPVQVSAAGMSPELLKRDFGGSITFHGAIDTQHVMPEGSVEDVRSETRRMIGIMGRGGGYILSGSQGFESDIPVENIIAMYDEGRKLKG